MKLKIMKYLIIGFIAILSLNIAKTYYNNYQESKTPIVRYEHKLAEKDRYIITQDTILNSFRYSPKIVSFEQDLHKQETDVNKNFFGERDTEITINGTVSLGLNPKDIKLIRMDSESVTLKLPKPIIVNLDVPFDKTDFDKTKGWNRLAMNDEEEKNFYKSTKKQIREDLLKNKGLMEQVSIFNEKNVESLVRVFGIKNVYFE